MKTTLLFAAATAIAALAMTAPAHAESISVSGSVNQICVLNPGVTNVNFGDLGRQGVENPITVAYSLYCNVGFDTSVSSASGRLLNANAGTRVGPESGPGANTYTNDPTGTFYAALDYSLTAGAITLSSASFSQGNVVPLTSNPPTNLSVPVVFNTVPLSAGHELTAGNYSDTLTITISPTGL